MTRTVERRRGERLYESSYSPNETLARYSTPSIIYRKLARILAKLGPLSEQRGLLKFLKNVDHANTLNGFVRDLACAVTDYQVRFLNSAVRTS